MTADPPIPTFATAHDLTVNLGTERQSIAMERATDLIRAEVDQLIAPKVTDDTAVIHPRGRRLIQLPQVPVTKVTSVSLRPPGGGADQLLAENFHYTVDLGRGWVERIWWHWPWDWPVVVVYDHGYEHLPPELTRLAAAIADKIIDGKIEVRQQSETWGSHNVSTTYARASDTIFSEQELKILEKYRPARLP